MVTFEDVTELESSRRRASLLADELRVMLDGVADAITVQSPDHRLIYANEAAYAVYGIPRGHALDDFSAAEYLERFEVTTSGERRSGSSSCRGARRSRASIPRR